MKNELILSDNVTIFRDQYLNDENNIRIQHCVNNENINILMNESILDLVFGYSITNCISNGIDSRYEYDNIFEIKSERGREAIDPFVDEPYFPRAKMKDSKYVIVRHYINILTNHSDNKINISIKTKLGFVKDLNDKLRLFSRSNYNINLYLNYKEAFELISFTMENENNKLHG